MAYCWFGVIGIGHQHRIPFGTRGRVLRRGPKRTLVDFGKLGRWRVPNAWLRDTSPSHENTVRLRQEAKVFGGEFGRELLGLT